jgi:hypothetical protein
VCEEVVDAFLVVVGPRRLRQQVVDDGQAGRPEQSQQVCRPPELARVRRCSGAGGQRSMLAMFAWSWRSPAAGVRLFTRSS